MKEGGKIISKVAKDLRNLVTVPNIGVNIKMANQRVREFISGIMESITKENGRKDANTAEDSGKATKEITMMVNGNSEILTVKALISGFLVICIQDSGKKASSTGMEDNNLQMEIYTLVIIFKVNYKVMDNITGKMEVVSKEIFKTD